MTAIRPTSANDQASVLHYETELDSRRRTEKGWVAGLPKRKSALGYQDYDNDAKLLEALHSVCNRIKATFTNQGKDLDYISAAIIAIDPIFHILEELGPSLWCGETERKPVFVDPTSKLDFSVEADKFRHVVLSSDCEF